MSENIERRAKKRFFADLTPLKYSPAFRRLWIGSSVSQIGAQVTIVAVGMHVFDITGSTLAVSMVALWALGPTIVAGIWGGMIADVFDRRIVSLITAVAAWCTIALMATVALMGVTDTWVYYLLAAVNASASTILSATKAAIMPRLLPANLISAASALQGITSGLAITVGPAIAGILVTTVGFGWTYLLDVVLFTGAFLGVLTLPPIEPQGSAAKPGLRSLIEGWNFLKSAPNIRATFIYDIVAMILGMPRAIFPAVGMLVLGGGYVTAGVLSAAIAVGALLSGVGSGWFGRVRWQGRAVAWSITGYGLSILVFGIVLLYGTLTGGGVEHEPRWTLIVLAFSSLALAGAADNVSAVFRNTILQVASPDQMRGRLQGVFTVVVTGGPRVGDLYVGIVAALIAVWAPPLFGGLAIIAIIAVFARVYAGFLAYDAHDPRP